MSWLDISRSDEDPRQSVLASCEGLHMLAHGSTDWSTVEADKVAVWLQSRVDSWKPSPPFAQAYDDTVLALARCALREYAEFRKEIS